MKELKNYDLARKIRPKQNPEELRLTRSSTGVPGTQDGMDTWNNQLQLLHDYARVSSIVEEIMRWERKNYQGRMEDIQTFLVEEENLVGQCWWSKIVTLSARTVGLARTSESLPINSKFHFSAKRVSAD